MPENNFSFWYMNSVSNSQQSRTLLSWSTCNCWSESENNLVIGWLTEPSNLMLHEVAQCLNTTTSWRAVAPITMYWKHPVGQSVKALIQEKVISNAPPPVHCTQDIGWVSLSNWLISFLACVRHIVSSFTKPWGSTCYIANTLLHSKLFSLETLQFTTIYSTVFCNLYTVSQ